MAGPSLYPRPLRLSIPLTTMTFDPSSATPDLVVPAASQTDQVASEAQASASVSLDAAQPVTSIQIRLADGGRLVHKFNHTHR